MKITQYKDKKLNIFTNSSKPGFELYSDIYGDHFKVGKQTIGDFPNVTKLEDYLYEITVDEMDEEFGLAHATGIGACSEVRRGQFQLRNYDWYFDSKISFIVKVAKKENRHASIGVSSISISKEDIANKNYSELFKVIPFTTLDGINDCSVYCGINVVPTGDKGKTTGTNKNGKDLPNICIPRYILDNATSAEQAINLLKQRNIYAINYDGQQIELHAMISDINKTYIVEFVNNKMVVLEQDINNSVMTNFYHNLGYINEHGMGIERYKILEANYNEGNTKDGMFALMKRVQFSNAYIKENKWYSDMNYTQSILSQTPEGQDPVRWDEVMSEQIKLWNDVYVAGDRTQGSAAPWITVHNSVYDLKNKTLQVVVQEDYEHKYNFSLQKK